jgi:hypothetical protein
VDTSQSMNIPEAIENIMLFVGTEEKALELVRNAF